MSLEVQKVYKTESGSFFRLQCQRGVLFVFKRVDYKGYDIPEKKNGKGLVVLRSEVSYTEEIAMSFKPTKI